MACALSSTTAVAAVRPVPEVLEDGAARTVLRIRLDGAPDRVRDFSFAVATPGPGLAQLHLRRVELDPTAVLDPADTETVDALPEFVLRPAGSFRGQWLEHLFVPSHRQNGGRLEAIREVELEIRYARASEHSNADPNLGRWLDRVVVNPTAARRFAGLGATDDLRPGQKRRGVVPSAIESTFGRSQNWIRIEIDRSGVYRIGYEDLVTEIGSAAANRVLAASLRIYSAPVPVQPTFPEADAASWADSLASWENRYALVQRALEVRAAGATLAPGDEFFVYMTGPEDWSDRYDPTADRWDHFEHEYADHLAYWLSWDEMGVGTSGDFVDQPLRMRHAGGDPAGASVVRWDYRARLRVEENLLDDYGRVRDNWVMENNLREGRPLSIDFQISELVPDSTAILWSEMYARRNGASNTDYPVLRQEFYFNRPNDGNPDHAPEWTFRTQEDEDDGPVVYRAGGVPLLAGLNTVTLSNATLDSVVVPRLVVDGFSLGYRRRLRPTNGVLEFAVYEDEATGAFSEFRIEDNGADWSNAIVLDTSNPWDPVWIDGGLVENAGQRLRFARAIGAAKRHHFLALQRSRALRPADIRVHTPRKLRQELANKFNGDGRGWQMVILHPEAFANAAERLRNYRIDHLPGHGAGADVEAVDLQDVYDVFGHGGKDPKAMRNFLKFVFNVNRDLEFVCLLGDASRDYRGRLSFGTPDPFAPEQDQVPTWIATQFPTNPGFSSRHPYAADDWFVSFEDPPFLYTTQLTADLPDAGIARLPAGTPTEANRLVDRIVSYEENPPSGAWRNTLLLAADDEFGSATGSQDERFHVIEAEIIAETLLAPEFHVDKLYLTDFPKLAGQPSKPAAKEAMKRRWSNGRLIVHYIGHGSPTQLADENLFSLQDVGFLENEQRLPLFLGLSCDVAIFDSPTNKSMSEQMVLERAGGAIATIAATQVTFVSLNNSLTEALYPQLFPGSGVGRSVALGEALLLAKLNTPGVSTDRLTQHNNQKYVLFCDPALRLQSPDLPALLAGGAATSIRSGQVQTLQARIEEGGQLRADLSGRYYVELRESAEFVEYRTFGANLRLDYRLDGAHFFQGSGEFQGGIAEFQLMSPVDMRFGVHGRIEVLLETPEGNYVAASDDHLVERAAVISTDAVGPVISLEFQNQAHRVSPGDVLLGSIEDPSGINVLGSAQLNSILIELDEEALPIDVSELFQLDEDSFTRGSLSFPLPDRLVEGEHHLQLFASDMLGNRSGAAIQFEVVAAGKVDIAAHAAFPNPFKDSTRFVIEVVSPGSVRLELDIYSLDGRPLRRLRRQESGDGSYIMHWDGLDSKGDEIANGAYLYTIRARFAGTEEIQQVRTGKIVRMR